MKRLFKFGCLGILGVTAILMIVVLVFASLNSEGESADMNEKVQKKEVMIDVNQFSRISSEKLIEIMGEPQEIDEYMWLVPSTGKEIPAKTYIYEDNKYDFMVLDDTVSRLNVYSGTYWGYDESVMEFENENDLFSMFNIELNDKVKKTADTNYALRYSPVSEKIAELWILEIENGKFGAAKITYNLNYY